MRCDGRAESTFGNLLAGLAIIGIVLVVVTATPAVSWLSSIWEDPKAEVDIVMFDTDVSSPWFNCIAGSNLITIRATGDFGTVEKTWHFEAMDDEDLGRTKVSPGKLAYEDGATVDLVLSVSTVDFYLTGFLVEDGEAAVFAQDYCPI